MNKLCFILLLCLFSLNKFMAQKTVSAKVTEIKCTGFAISKPLSECTVVDDNDNLSIDKKKEVEQRRTSPKIVNKQKTSFAGDPIAQRQSGLKTMSPPIANWQGLSGSGYPPDPSGAVSANYYFQAVNTQYRVYTKTGGAVVGGGPFNLSSLWAGSTDDGDPIVMYDRYADRWFMSQFNGFDRLLIAVSTSSNPLGTYFTYTFVPSAGSFPDYPKYSIWSDGYYFSTNIGEPNKIGAMNRTKILAGDPTATMISLDLPPTPNVGFFCPLTACADGVLPPFGTPCPAFSYEDDTWDIGGADRLRIFKIIIDWVTPSSSSVVLDQMLDTSPINVDFDPSWDDVPQPGTSQKLDAINGVLNFRAQYRRWVGYNTVVLCQAVIVEPTTKQVGVRWYELRQDVSSGIWSIYQEGTYAPDGESRWLGSIAMDDNGSIGLAYAVSSEAVSPSLRYTGRNAHDPLGTMTFTETSAIVGSGAQSFFNRFGDYSQTEMDPDGLTFWHTGEYLISGNPRTRIYSFKIPVLDVGVSEGINQSSLIVFANKDKIEVNALNLPNNEEAKIELYTIDGRELSSQKVVPVQNKFNTSIFTNNISKGVYIVRVGNAYFQKTKKIVVE